MSHIKEYWIYILNCNNGNYYTGYTVNLARRYQEHITGTTKCKYTRSFKPISIAQCWKTNDKTLAMFAERFIKKLTKDKKRLFVLNPERLIDQLQNKISTASNRLSKTPFISLAQPILSNDNMTMPIKKTKSASKITKKNAQSIASWK